MIAWDHKNDQLELYMPTSPDEVYTPKMDFLARMALHGIYFDDEDQAYEEHLESIDID